MKGNQFTFMFLKASPCDDMSEDFYSESVRYFIDRVLTCLWYTFEYILLASFDKSNCCSNPWFYFIVLWAYYSFQYCWIMLKSLESDLRLPSRLYRMYI